MKRFIVLTMYIADAIEINSFEVVMENYDNFL